MALPKIYAFVEGVCVCEALLDTGAAVNILNSALVPKGMTFEPALAGLQVIGLPSCVEIKT